MISVFDFSCGSNDHVASALAYEGVRLEAAKEIGDAAGAVTTLILAGEIGADVLGRIAELRSRFPATPVIVITDRDDVERRLGAYEAGADDCLSKPFHLQELLAKLRALGRRASSNRATPLLAHADTVVDQAAMVLKIADRVRRLTKREADLLVTLARAGGGVVGREAVLRDAWDASQDMTGNLVDVYVGYARRKLDQLGADVSIQSVRGEGFRLVGRDAGRSPRRSVRPELKAERL